MRRRLVCVLGAAEALSAAVAGMTSTTTITPARLAEMAHALAVLAETDPRNPLLLAVRLALDVADARDVERTERQEIGQAGLQVHGGEAGRWRRWADNYVPYSELQRRRAVPGPMTAAARAS